jgi:diacylglycerol O-acyltransferase
VRRVAGRDAMFLYAERPAQLLHTQKLLVFEAPLELEAVRAALAGRAAALRPLRERVIEVPLGVFHPVWIDRGAPDLRHHVRAIRAPVPGGRRELEQLVEELATQPLDRRFPLWELWVVEGLEPGLGALILKLHHAIADGHTAEHILSHLFDPDLPPESPACATPGPESAPTRSALLTGAGRDLLSLASRSPALAARVARAIIRARSLRRSGRLPTATLLAVPAMRWNRLPPTPRRSFSTVSVEKAEVREVARVHGAASHQVLLAAISGALRSYLKSRGELPRESLTATVPVSVRTEADEVGGNHVATLFVPLATDQPDPFRRLEAVRRAMESFHEQRASLDLGVWEQLWEVYPLVRAVYRLTLWWARRTERCTFSVIASTMRGPSHELRCTGVALRELYPANGLNEDLGLNITTWSYLNRIGFGLVSCPEFIPELSELAALIPVALQELRLPPEGRPTA